MVSAHSQKHSLKLSSEGIEAFVEYYSTSGDILTLECTWKDDKYVLHEVTHCRNESISEEQGALPFNAPIEYQTLECLGDGSCTDQETKLPVLQPHTHCSIKSVDLKISPVTGPVCEPISDNDLQKSSTSLKPRSKSRKTVAFVAVQIPKSSEMEPSEPVKKKMRLDLPSCQNFDGSTADIDSFQDFPFSGAQNISLF